MPPEIVEEALRFTAGDLALEGVLAYPAGEAPEGTLLVLAPHPHMGGRMDNNVVRHLARRAAETGSASLRFNYRGVGSSEIALPAGTSRYDHFAAMERGQRYEELLPDALAAYRTLEDAAGALPRRVVVGYSLGAILAGMLGARVGATHLAGISPPVARAPLDTWRGCAQPKLFVGGDADFAFDVARFRDAYAALPEPKRFERLEGADHFYRKEEERVFDALARWLAEAG